MKEILSALHREDSGQDLVEYALLVALLGLAAAAGMSYFASGTVKMFSYINYLVTSTET